MNFFSVDLKLNDKNQQKNGVWLVIGVDSKKGVSIHSLKKLLINELGHIYGL